MNNEKLREVELLPCPFCGGEANLTIGFDVPFHGESFIDCITCKIQTELHDSTEDAIAVWNKRAAPVTPVAQAGQETVGEVTLVKWGAEEWAVAWHGEILAGMPGPMNFRKHKVGDVVKLYIAPPVLANPLAIVQAALDAAAKNVYAYGFQVTAGEIRAIDPQTILDGMKK